MGFNNPAMTWSELHRKLSAGRPIREAGTGDGGDSPAWSRKREAYQAAPVERPRGRVPYAELHCHSNFSFLDGASHPEELVEEAVRLGLEALALTDHDGFYGIVRFAEAARAHGLPTIFGAELSLGLPGPQNGEADPHGEHLLVLARDPAGYASLARAMATAHLTGKEKGRPVYDLAALSAVHEGHWLVLTGCRKGPVPAALAADGPRAAARKLADMVALFGRDNVVVELWDHGEPLDSARNDALVQLADRAGLGVVATNNVHYATPARRRLATALAAVRARRSLDEIDPWLPASSAAHLRAGVEQERRFRRYPGAVALAAELGNACAFDLRLVAPDLPPFPCPDGLTEMQYLRRLTEEGATRRYGPRGSERVNGAYRQIDHELDLIEALGFPGYFLVVWDIVRFCNDNGIYCQGRGSAANSAVCYALGVTNADAVQLGLLFERFLSPERDGPPDIDIDIESARREEAIQYVYAKHGREHAAQVANVITYRAKSAIRDMAKALGHSTGQQDAWSKQADAWGPVRATAQMPDHDIPEPVLELAKEVEHFPRHLGVHSGGMVICDRPVVEVCPVEWARFTGRNGTQWRPQDAAAMPAEDELEVGPGSASVGPTAQRRAGARSGAGTRGPEPIRTVLQWDKDDCAAVGLVKFDLLGLGMLTAIHSTIDHIAEAHGEAVDIATIDQDDAVYDMLCRADSVGVFQVESRAQMATLPRLKPRCFYDLVVEVALIRPGPIQGGSVHPYIRRRNGEEAVTYMHPLAERALEKTLGVPLFQEQLMQLAIDVGGFTAAESDQLRQAMGSKRSRERMEQLRRRFHEGARKKGVDDDAIEVIWEKLAAFANYGFPESHSVSFGYLVYASSWLKRWYPAAFCAGLLGAQPMGFYSAHSLVQDARRHGVEVRRPDVNASRVQAHLETDVGTAMARRGAPPHEWGRGGPAVRLGLATVRGIGEELAAAMVAGQPFADMEDLRRRVPQLTLPQLEALATAGAFERCFGLDRRAALWQAGAVAQSTPDRLAGVVTGVHAPPLPGMEPREASTADLWSTGVSAEGHPTLFVRAHLDSLGVTTAAGLRHVEAGTKALVGGVVTHRQRPATAQGTIFVNLEDETGFVNVVVSKGCWARYRRAARSAPALLVRGRVEKESDVINVVAEHIEALPLGAPTTSRDFR